MSSAKKDDVGGGSVNLFSFFPRKRGRGRPPKKETRGRKAAKQGVRRGARCVCKVARSPFARKVARSPCARTAGGRLGGGVEAVTRRVGAVDEEDEDADEDEDEED